MEFVHDEEGNIGMNAGYFEKLLMPAVNPDCKLTELCQDSLKEYIEQRFSRVLQEVANEFGDAGATELKNKLTEFPMKANIRETDDKVETLDRICLLDVAYMAYLREESKRSA